MTENRRNSERKDINLWVKEIDGDYYFLHNAKNVSQGGMYLENIIPRQPKKEMKLSINIPNKDEIRLNAKLVHDNDKANLKNGFGVEFVDFEKGRVEDLFVNK